jgi:hypothetical protein
METTVCYTVRPKQEVVMAFERFTQVGRTFRPRASIRTSGQIGFNGGTVARFKLEKWQFAVLFYDKQEKKIGIKLTKDPKEDGVLRLIVRAGNAAISARSFFDYYEIDYSVSRQFDVSLDEKTEMLVIDMREA